MVIPLSDLVSNIKMTPVSKPFVFGSVPVLGSHGMQVRTWMEMIFKLI